MTTRHLPPPKDRTDDGRRVEAMLGLLRLDGGRITTGRRAIVEALIGADHHHVTADDVASAVQADQPDVHLTTVYRTLDALERLGAVARLSLGPGGAVYHLADQTHHHLVCERCGAVAEIDGELVEPWADQIAGRYDFTAHHLTVLGRCADCST